jgi:hypothetical protein
MIGSRIMAEAENSVSMIEMLERDRSLADAD